MWALVRPLVDNQTYSSLQHQEGMEALENRQLEASLSNPSANAVIFQEDVRTEEEWQKFDEEIDEAIISDEGEEKVR